ncbi:hypothetical protein [Streptomyces sp. NPDC006997]|uniref:hypothetical protein n=1 Tax=Streptomyces sp. NPDC006997 TaxID=3155356 RepID=UPI0033DB0BA7
MPRSVFLGRVVADGEPLWLEEDRAWALALTQVEADICPDCGQPWAEATSTDAEFAYRAELIRCHACTASAQAVKAYQDQGGASEGLHVHLTRST